MGNRRQFLQQLATAGLLLGTGNFPLEALTKQAVKLTILHTNDVHSRIEPFTSGRNEGLGGAARRAALISQIRSQEENVLLVDSGDIFQGTPYFNFFHGELEFKLMEQMGYEAATLGNHDFDGGMEALLKQMKTVSFPMLNANYGFAKTPLDGYVKPYQIVQKGALKIGIFGVGIDLEGLVPPKLFGKTTYTDPISVANKTATHLKEVEKCHLVLCLSHLGYKYRSDKVCDVVLAQKSSHIDIILGGHTHTFLEEPTLLKNQDGETVIVNQAGWAGILLGRLDITFSPFSKKKQVKSESIVIGKTEK